MLIRIIFNLLVEFSFEELFFFVSRLDVATVSLAWVKWFCIGIALLIIVAGIAIGAVYISQNGEFFFYSFNNSLVVLEISVNSFLHILNRDRNRIEFTKKSVRFRRVESNSGGAPDQQGWVKPTQNLFGLIHEFFPRESIFLVFQ